VIVSNHPSLIDVVIYIVLVPKTLYVAKSALIKNPFMSMIVRHTSLPDDETLPKTAKAYLEDGWNVLVFPEGTRSPDEGLWPFHRGAAHVALESGAPVVVSRMTLSRRILGKRQKPWDMGEERVVYSILSDPPMAVSQRDGESRHAAAKRITSELMSAMRPPQA
jgi:1-acyl-sn-glycerol-3-phosphate acyltransferase